MCFFKEETSGYKQNWNPVKSQKFQIDGWDVENAGSWCNPDFLAGYGICNYCNILQHSGILRLKLLLQNSKTLKYESLPFQNGEHGYSLKENYMWDIIRNDSAQLKDEEQPIFKLSSHQILSHINMPNNSLHERQKIE
jgi:hypothetical protein